MTKNKNLIDYFHDFINHLKIKTPSKNTIKSYQYDLEQFADFLKNENNEHIQPHELNRTIIRKWLSMNNNNLSAASKARKIACLKSLVKYLIKHKILSHSPIELLKSPKIPKQVRPFYNVEKMNTLLETPSANPLEQRNNTMLELIYACALRISELTNIDIKDLNLENNWLLVQGKGSKQREVPLTNLATKKLITYIQISRPQLHDKNNNQHPTALFLSTTGKRLTTNAIRNALKKIQNQNALPTDMTPHGMRHAAATHLLQSGADLRAIQDLLGHENLSTTAKYTHNDYARIEAVYDKAHPRAHLKK